MMLATQLAESQRTSYATSLPRGLATDKTRSHIDRPHHQGGLLLQFTSISSLERVWLGVRATAPPVEAVPRLMLEPGLELRFAVKTGDWMDGKDGKPNFHREADGSPKYEKSELTIYVLGRQPDGSLRVLMQHLPVGEKPVITWANLFPDGRLRLILSATPNLEYDSLRTIFPLLPKDAGEAAAGWSEVDRAPTSVTVFQRWVKRSRRTATVRSTAWRGAAGRFSTRSMRKRIGPSRFNQTADGTGIKKHNRSPSPRRKPSVTIKSGSRSSRQTRRSTLK